MWIQRLDAWSMSFWSMRPTPGHPKNKQKTNNSPKWETIGVSMCRCKVFTLSLDGFDSLPDERFASRNWQRFVFGKSLLGAAGVRVGRTRSHRRILPVPDGLDRGQEVPGLGSFSTGAKDLRKDGKVASTNRTGEIFGPCRVRSTYRQSSTPTSRGGISCGKHETSSFVR